MAKIFPCPRSDIGQVTRQDWHTVFRPSWETLVAAGYVSGTSNYSYTEGVVELSSGDGEVGLNGGDLLKERFRPLSASGETMYVLAENANEEGKSFIVSGVDENGDAQQVTDTITAAGVAQALTGLWAHVNSVQILSTSVPGTTTELSVLAPVWVSNSAAGTPPDPATDNVPCVLRPGRGKGMCSRQLAARSEAVFLNDFVFSSAKGDETVIRLYFGDDELGYMNETLEIFMFQTTFAEVVNRPLVLQQQQWVEMTAAQVSQNNIDVTGVLSGYGLIVGSQFPPNVQNPGPEQRAIDILIPNPE